MLQKLLPSPHKRLLKRGGKLTGTPNGCQAFTFPLTGKNFTTLYAQATRLIDSPLTQRWIAENQKHRRIYLEFPDAPHIPSLQMKSAQDAAEANQWVISQQGANRSSILFQAKLFQPLKFMALMDPETFSEPADTAPKPPHLPKK